MDMPFDCIFFLFNIMRIASYVLVHALTYLQDPFLLISKLVEGGNAIPICKTEVIKNDLNPTWKPIFLNIQQVGSKVFSFIRFDMH